MKFYIFIILIATFLYFFLRPSLNTVPADFSADSTRSEVLAVTEKRNKDEFQRPLPPALQAGQMPTMDTQGDSAEILGSMNMNTMLKQLATCTEIKNSVTDGPVEPTLTAILDSVQSELGEPVIRSEDWNTIEVKYPDNSKRLVRIETVYEDDDIVKKLRYYQVTPTQLTPLELTAEQSVNPSETFLASLEKEGDVVSRERSERVFFQNGEEISYVEKNGRIQSSEIIRAGKSLKCNDYGQKSFRCQCF